MLPLLKGVTERSTRAKAYIMMSTCLVHGAPSALRLSLRESCLVDVLRNTTPAGTRTARGALFRIVGNFGIWGDSLSPFSTHHHEPFRPPHPTRSFRFSARTRPKSGPGSGAFAPRSAGRLLHYLLIAAAHYKCGVPAYYALQLLYYQHSARPFY